MPSCSHAHLEMVVAALPGGSGGTSPPGSALARDKDWCPLLNCLVSSRLCTHILSETTLLQVTGRWSWTPACPAMCDGAHGPLKSALCALPRAVRDSSSSAAWAAETLPVQQLPCGAGELSLWAPSAGLCCLQAQKLCWGTWPQTKHVGALHCLACCLDLRTAAVPRLVTA